MPQPPCLIPFAVALVVAATGCGGDGRVAQPASASTPPPAATATVPTPDPPVDPTRSGDPLIAAAGDIACAPGDVKSAAECHQVETGNVIRRLDPELVLPLGDLQYNRGEIEDFKAIFDVAWGSFKKRMRPVPGNHEYGEPGAQGYLDYFGAQARPQGTTYYSYDAGEWHLIALDSNCTVVGCGPKSRQVAWLKRDLRANRAARCTLAYWHHPRFTGGRYSDQTQVATLYSTLYNANADIVLAGHDHGYMRLAKLDASGRPDSKRGIQSFVVGTGGRNHYETGRRKYIRAANSAVFGVLALKLRSGGWSWRFAPEAGATYRDAGRATCH